MPTYVATSRIGLVFKRIVPPAKPITYINSKPVPVFTHGVIVHLRGRGRPRANWMRSLAEAQEAAHWWRAQEACEEVELVELRVQVPLSYPRWRAIDNPLPKQTGRRKAPRLLEGADVVE
jgi:hypothetical protein